MMKLLIGPSDDDVRSDAGFRNSLRRGSEMLVGPADSSLANRRYAGEQELRGTQRCRNMRVIGVMLWVTGE